MAQGARESKVVGEIGLLEEELLKHKQAKEALRIKDSAIASSINAIAFADLEGNLTYVNPSFLKLWGYDDEREVLGKPAVEFWQMEEKAAQVVEALRDRGGWIGELVAKRKDGSLLDVHLSASMVTDEAGKPICMMASFVDVTERKRAEEALQESEERFRSLFENSTIGLYRTTPDGRILLVNPTLVRMLGYSSFDELALRNLEEEGFEPDYPRSRFREQIEREGEVKGLEAAWRRRDGSVILVRESAKPVRDADGTILYYEGTVEDITERKRAEEALRESEEKYRNIFETAPDGIVTINLKGIVTSCNSAFTNITGFSKSEIVGKHFSKLPTLRARDIPQYIKLFNSLMRGRVPKPFEARWLHKDETTHWAEIRVSLMKEGRKTIGFQAIERDITERKQAEEKVRRRSEELAALNTIAMTVTSTLDLQEVLQTIQERVVTLLEEKYPPFFSLFDEANQTIEVVVTGTPKKILERAEKLMGVKFEELIFPLSTVNPAVREALLAGKPYVTDDVSDLLGPRVSRRLVQGAQSALGVKSIVDLPLRVKGKFVGIMALLSQKEKVSEQEMELLSSIASQAAIAIDNARLYEQAQARSAYLETLLQINATLRSTLPLSQVLETIVQGATEALGYVGSLITVPDATGDRLVFGAAWGGRFMDAVIRLTGFKLESFGLPLKAEENPIVWAYLTGELQTSSGAPERIVVGIEPPVGRRLARAIERTMGAKLAACVPLRLAEKAVGVLTVFSPREQLPDDEQAMLLGLADQGGLAIENARLYEELRGELTERKRAEEEMRRRSGELAALNAIAEAVSGPLDLKELLQQALDKVFEITGFEAGGFGFVDETKELIVPMTHRGVPQDFLATFAQPRAGDGLRWQSVKSGEAIFFENLPHDPRIRGREALIKGFRAGAYLPLKVQDKSIGFMALGTDHDHHFSPEEKSLLTTIASQIAMAIENAQAYQKLKTLNLETISALAAAVEAKDPYTRGHSEKVAQFAIAIAEKLGITNDEIEDLQVAALLHDIGKIGIPDSVLNKPARLTSAEFLMIKTHPVIAAEIVGKIEALAHLVPIIRHHHERYDGQGYPDGLKGKEIPLGARILAVADGFEAMTSERPYRRARTEEEALAELQKGAATQWDPKVVEVFVKICEEGALKHQAGGQ